MRATLFLLLVGCHRTEPAPVQPPLAVVEAAASAAHATELSETDFRGSFNGAPLYATLAAHGGVASGTCFYEAVGTDIPLQGSLAADGSMSLAEMDGASSVSSITLAQGSDGSWTGTWKSADGARNGVAALSPIARHVGDPVTVVARRVHQSSRAMCHSTMGTPAAPCSLDARVPVVLGLEDRAFQKTLDAKLAAMSSMDPPPNNAGLRMKIDHKVVLNARGLVSITINGGVLSELACDKPDADCAGAYEFSHNVGYADGVTVAVDKHVIASTPKDFLDVEKARVQLARVISGGYAQCVTSFEGDPLDELSSAVLTPTGVSIVHDECSNHVHNAGAWAEIPYAKLKPALRAGSPFEDAWTTR